jgi:hypothetical protein
MRQKNIVTTEIQSLESRRMLSAVTVSGSNSGEEIRVYYQSNTLVADVDGIIQSYPGFLYDGVVINGLGGADSIYVESNGELPVTVNGGNGTDSIYLGNGTLDGLESPVSITASAGDKLFLDDSADAFGETYSVNGSGVTRSFFGGVAYSAIAEVRITAGSEVDTFNVSNTAGTPIVVDGQGGADILNLNTTGVGTSEVVFENNQDFTRINGNTGGKLTLRGEAGLVLTDNDSDFEADLFLDRGYVIERGSQTAGGLGYWRERLLNAGTNASPQLRATFADASTISDAIGYGYAQNIAPTTIDGVALDDGDLVLRYTLRGDANLDKAVNFNDLLALAQNYSPTVTGRLWTQGDFNLSGKTDFDDLLALAQNYGQSAVRTPARSTRGAVRGDVLA